MAEIYAYNGYKGSFLDSHGATITKVNNPTFKNRGKGFGMECNSSEYIYSGVVAGNFNTILLEFFLFTEVTAASGYNYLGSLENTLGGMGFGALSGAWSGETFWWFGDTSAAGGGYIRETIKKGYNQIILKYNGSYYDCWLNGVQVTTYNNGSDYFNNDPVYLGARQNNVGFKFTGHIQTCKIYDHSFTTTEIAQAYNSFKFRSPWNPPIRGFEADIEQRDLLLNQGYENNITGCAVTFSAGAGSISHNTTTPLSGLGSLNLAVTSPDSTNRPILKLSSGLKYNTIVGKTYECSFDYRLNSGICNLRLIYIGNSVIDLGTGNVYLTGTGTYKYRFVCTASNILNNLYFNGSSLFNIDIDNVILREVSANPSLVETFDRCPADGKTVNALQDWKQGTATVNCTEIAAGKTCKWVTDGTSSIHAGTNDSSKTMILIYDIGAGEVTATDSIANLVTSIAELSFANGFLTFDLDAGEYIRNIKILP